MSKLDFLKQYLLNDTFLLDEFLNVANVSLRGFMFEAIWDICIKCNVVPQLSQAVAHHVEGKIETLRTTPKELVKRLRSCQVIDSVYDYLKTSKLQSGSTGGVSDITLLYMPKGQQTIKRYILISSKFFIDEKALNNYDVAALVHAMKETNTEFEVVLLVNDRKAIMNKITTTRKRQVVEFLSEGMIFDKTDLNMYLVKLRKLFGILSTTDAKNRNDKVYRDYFRHRWLPLIPYKFHHALMFNLAKILFKQGNVVVWRSQSLLTLNLSILYYILRNSEREKFYVCAPQHAQVALQKMAKQFYGYNKAYIHYGEEMPKGGFDVLFVFGVRSLKSKLLSNCMKHKCNGVLIINSRRKENNTNDNTDTIEWNIENCINIGKPGWDKYISRTLINNLQENNDQNNTNISDIVEKTLEDIYGDDVIDSYESISYAKKLITSLKNDYASNPSLEIYSVKGLTWHSNTFTKYQSICKGKKIHRHIDVLLTLLFGSRQEHNEKYVIFNRVGYQANSDILWLVSENHIQDILQCFVNNDYLKPKVFFTDRSKRQDGVANVFLASDFDETTNYNNIILTNPTVTFDDVLKYVSGVYDVNEGRKITIVDFSNNRIQRYKEMFNEGVFDLDCQ